MTTVEYIDADTVLISDKNKGWLLSKPFNDEVKKILIVGYVFLNQLTDEQCKTLIRTRPGIRKTGPPGREINKTGDF